MSTDEPFFEPLPPPSEEEIPHQVHNVPWSPPLNVVPVVLPVGRDVVANDRVVIRLDEVRVFDRGVEIRLESWNHPDSAPVVEGQFGMTSSMRFGVRLADGTRLGASMSALEPDPGADGPLLTQSNGMSDSVRSSFSWWLRPIPDDGAHGVVAWADLGVPETVVPLDTAAWREASRGARELWPLPDFNPEKGLGWFAYTPQGESVCPSRLGMGLDPDEEGRSDPTR